MKVLMSTFNGMATLPRMLAGLARLTPPPGGFELHVADNGSTDGTADLLGSWRRRLPLHIHHAPVAGKNHALNLLVERSVDDLSDRELVVLTDDDILPDKDWLVSLARAAKARDDSVFTGPILPVWPGPVPDWMPGLSRYYGPLFTVTSHAPGPCRCIDAWGPNMAVRGSVFRSGVRFNARFGPDGTRNFPMGSETELMRRLDRGGYTAFFVAGASVGHLLREEVLTRDFIRARAFRHGLGCGLMGGRDGEGQARTLARLGVQNLAAAVIGWPLARDAQRARREYQWQWGRGVLAGLMRPAPSLADVPATVRRAVALPADPD